MTDAAVLTPFVYDLARPHGPRRFRKQLLPVGSIRYSDVYGTRQLDFSRDYLADLARSFAGRARSAVNFFLAGPRNEHNEDSERLRGQLVDVDVAADGLYGVIELSDAGAKLVGEHPDLGVSCRIRETPGNRHPRVIEHVLGTFDPRVRGMAGWQPIDLSNPTGAVIDLSNEQWSTTSDYEQALIDLAYSDADAETRVAALDLHSALVEEKAAASRTVDLALAAAQSRTNEAQRRIAAAQKFEGDRLAADVQWAVDEAIAHEGRLAHFRANYEPWRNKVPVTADLAIPADEPQLDARTAQIRKHRRLHGI